MPFYEYHCSLCGQNTTLLQKVSDAPATDCPACGKPGLSKQISAAGFRLKGGGWYETDFKSDNKKNLAGDSGTSGSTSEKTSSSESSAAAPAASAPAAATP